MSRIILDDDPDDVYVTCLFNTQESFTISEALKRQLLIFELSTTQIEALDTWMSKHSQECGMQECVVDRIEAIANICFRITRWGVYGYYAECSACGCKFYLSGEE